MTSGVTWLLRADVLRPGERPQDMAFPGDDEPGTAHFAAYDTSGPNRARDEVVGVVTVLPAPEVVGGAGAPGSTSPVVPGGAAWQLRLLATAERVRGRGAGRALVERVVDHVARSGGGSLWANARTGSLGFYERGGWDVVSDVFDRPQGPHVRVRRHVPGAGGGVTAG